MNNESKIIVLMGESASGKDFYLNLLLGLDLGLNKVITYTDRTKRSNEEHKKDYYFINEDCMEHIIEDNSFLEYSTYHTIYGDFTYGTHINSFQNDTKNHIIVLDYEGFKRVQKMYPRRTIGFLLHLDKETRKNNYIKRGGDKEEFERREEDDKKKFKEAKKDESIYHVTNNIDDFTNTLNLIRDLIKNEVNNE